MKKETIENKWISTVGEKIYSLIKHEIDSDGWFSNKKNQVPIQLLFMMDNRYNETELRPKSLRRIEDNFGWSKPLVDGLPKRTGEYVFLAPNKVQHTIYVSNPLSKIETNHLLNDFTHYKPSKIEPLPLH